MRKPTFILFLFLALPLASPAENSPRGVPPKGASPREIVAHTINLLRGHSNVALYEVEIVNPRWRRRLKLKAWDKRMEKKVFVRILEPAKDEGTGFLRIDYNLWMYLPSTEKVMKIPPSMMLQPWMGSDFTNDDLVKESSYIDDYDHTLEGVETKEGEALWRIRLDPKPHAPVVWGKVFFWIRKADFIPLRQAFYDERGRLIKNLEFSEVKKMGGTTLPSVWRMESVNKEGHYTTLTLKEIQFNPLEGIRDEIFTEKQLRRSH
ncbi:MAG: outer membrane lipoprotein-sorting protein [Deltaproteobacteria bacterium]|nr:outer membrane lipoprotein-sorting protein [Deltaproteobacteria bacterium]